MARITVVGLGPGAAGHLSLETMGLLKNSSQVILRTAVHPTVSELEKEKVEFSSCDDLYETAASFEDVYNSVVSRVIDAAKINDVVYAVPGSPLVAEKTVVLMRDAAKEAGVELVIKPAMSFLDLAYVELGIDPISGLRIIDALDEDAVVEAGSYPLMITQVYSRILASDLKIMLMEPLPDDYEIYFLRNLGLPDAECRPIPLFELDRQDNIDHLTSVYIPPIPQSSKGIIFFGDDEEVDDEDVEVMTGDQFEEDFYDLAEGEEYTDSLADVEIQPLVDVMRVLREPGGCPWDREQDHKSIRSNFVEEVYEFLEAVDNNDAEGMCEELGDVLMQVVFHARMAEEVGKFDMQDVIDGVVDKLIRRHPHVFGDVSVKDSAEVLVNWEAIKKEEKQERKHVLDGVAKGLPALLRAYTLQRKAAKVGFDWDNANDVWDKVSEEIVELKEALNVSDKEHAEKELGDVLFAITNYARHKGFEPEVALTGANDRFASRFTYVERKVSESQKDWKNFTLAQLDEFWDEAKLREKN